MKILIVGLGGIGQRHLRNLRQLLGDTVEILAYRVRRNLQVLTDKLQIEEGASLEDKYRIKVFDDLAEALQERPTVAFICNPTSLHMPVALACAQAGCHLFIEKPLSHDLADVQKLCELAEEKGLKCFVGYQMRFHPCLKYAYACLRESLLGKIITVRAVVGEYLPSWHPYEDYRQMYASRRDLGGGVVVTQIHEIDYLYWFFGVPQRLFALGGHLSSLEIDVEDTASILMECGGVPVHLQQDYVQRPPSRNLEIVGDVGKLVVDLRCLTTQLFDSNGDLVETKTFAAFERNQLFLDELQHFLAVVAGKEQSLVSLRDGVQSLRVALAAKESIATGKVVSL